MSLKADRVFTARSVLGVSAPVMVDPVTILTHAVPAIDFCDYGASRFEKLQEVADTVFDIGNTVSREDPDPVPKEPWI